MKEKGLSLEDTKQIISGILSEAGKYKDELKCYEVWDKYLSKHLKFPFDAIVIDNYGSEVFKLNDQISIKNIDNYVSLYGLIAEVRFGRKKYFQQLCDTKVTDKKTTNYLFIEAYKEWFCNR
jgi:hypothetical protein